MDYGDFLFLDDRNQAQQTKSKINFTMWMQFNFLPSAYCGCRKWITMVYNKITRTQIHMRKPKVNHINK